MSERSVSPQRGNCGCSLEWRKLRPNGTCGTCGGWLPGRRENTPWGRQGLTLTEMWHEPLSGKSGA